MKLNELVGRFFVDCAEGFTKGKRKTIRNSNGV